MKFLPIAIAAAVLASPANARTDEELATGVGRMTGTFEHAVFLCRAEGHKMKTLTDVNPETAAAFAAMAKDSELKRYFKYGFEQGVVAAQTRFDQDGHERACLYFQVMIAKQKK